MTTTTKFTAHRRVRFSDCDPAGIVFFPNYFVMLNGFVEQWFDEGLHVPYAALVRTRRAGLPTVRLEVDFTAITRHGEDLQFELSVARLGRSSMILHHRFSCAGELRFAARQVLVCTNLETHRPQALPDDIRSAMAPFVETGEARP